MAEGVLGLVGSLPMVQKDAPMQEPRARVVREEAECHVSAVDCEITLDACNIRGGLALTGSNVTARWVDEVEDVRVWLTYDIEIMAMNFSWSDWGSCERMNILTMEGMCSSTRNRYIYSFVGRKKEDLQYYQDFWIGVGVDGQLTCSYKSTSVRIRRGQYVLYVQRGGSLEAARLHSGSAEARGQMERRMKCH